MIATLSSAPAAGRPSTLLRFGRWWMGQLAALVPAFLRRAVGLEGQDILVLAAADGFRLRRRGRDGPIDLGDLSALPDDAADARIVLQVPADRAFVKTVRLPAAAAENLAEVLGFEMDRQTPFQPDQVYYGHAVLSRDRADKTLQVRLSVVPRAVVTAALTGLGRHGVKPDIVEVADADRLLAIPGIAAERSGVGSLNRVLAVFVLLLLVAAIASPVAFQYSRIAEMEREIAVLAPRVEAAMARRGVTDRLADGAAEAVGARLSAPFATIILEELSRLLPDDTWLVQFNLIGGRVEIEGSAVSATKLVGLLEGSPLFSAVTFRAPLTANAVTRREHFQFVIELAPR